MSKDEFTFAEIEALSNFIQVMPIFSGLAKQELVALINIAYKEEYRKGEVIYRQGDNEATIYIIYEGTVSLTEVTPQGDVVDGEVVGPGTVLGELSVLRGTPRETKATALTNVVTLVFAREDLKALNKVIPRLWERFKPRDKRAYRLVGAAFALNDRPDGDDDLGFDEYAKAFATLLANPATNPPLTMGIYGKWGTGKSFLMRKIRDTLKKGLIAESQEYVFVDFNAWAYSGSENLWAALVSRIYEQVEKHLGKDSVSKFRLGRNRQKKAKAPE